MSDLHEALRAWATSPDTNRALRALHGAAGAELGAGPVFVVLLAGAFAPETATSWHEVNGRRVALVPLAVARDIATGRHPATVAALLETAPPERGAWCLAIGPAGEAHAWSTPVRFAGAGARVTARGGDA